MKLFPLFQRDGHSTCPMGMPMCQNRLAVPTWSYAMEKHPPSQIVEIGTFSGGLAIALGLHARVIGAKLVTYDIALPTESLVPIGTALGVEFRTASCWDREAEIASIIHRAGVSYVLCDGGNKPRELATFAHHLKRGDVIAVHDYDAGHEIQMPPDDRPWPWSEVQMKQIAPIAAQHDLEPFMQEHFDLAGWCVLRKR